MYFILKIHLSNSPHLIIHFLPIFFVLIFFSGAGYFTRFTIQSKQGHLQMFGEQTIFVFNLLFFPFISHVLVLPFLIFPKEWEWPARAQCVHSCTILSFLRLEPKLMSLRVPGPQIRSGPRSGLMLGEGVNRNENPMRVCLHQPRP